MQTTTVEKLPCKLNAQEKLLKGEQLAAKHGEIAQLEEAKKSAGSSFTSSIKQKKIECTQLAEEVRAGEELRPVECVERPRYQEMMVDLVRLDTGMVVSNRPMHPSERQAALELGDAPRSKATRPPPRKGKGREKTTMSLEASEEAH
jgi:hypothetical protein